LAIVCDYSYVSRLVNREIRASRQTRVFGVDDIPVAERFFARRMAAATLSLPARRKKCLLTDTRPFALARSQCLVEPCSLCVATSPRLSSILGPVPDSHSRILGVRMPMNKEELMPRKLVLIHGYSVLVCGICCAGSIAVRHWTPPHPSRGQ
jgi:hypothetical protein